MTTLIQKKICMVGDFAVGKTSLVRRYVEGRFDDQYLSTIGVKISRKEIITENTIVRLVIWDVAGNGKIGNLINSYLMGTSGAFLICDLTRPNTIQSLGQYKELVDSINHTPSLIILGNKVDLIGGRSALSFVEEVASDLKVPFIPTSAKTGEGVDAAFLALADKLLSNQAIG